MTFLQIWTFIYHFNQLHYEPIVCYDQCGRRRYSFTTDDPLVQRVRDAYIHYHSSEKDGKHINSPMFKNWGPYYEQRIRYFKEEHQLDHTPSPPDINGDFGSFRFMTIALKKQKLT